MAHVLYAAESPLVTDEYGDRGAEIQKRIDALGITDREFYAKTGIDRKTLRRAVEGVEGTRASTYIAIEAALAKLENAVRGKAVTHRMGEEDYVEFTVEGNFGVRAVVRGPVKDMDELQRAVGKLVREMRGEQGDE